jgi:hypothetical protein
MTVLLAGALFETTTEKNELALPPGRGVTGFGLKPAETPDGNVEYDRVTGMLKPLRDCTVTMTVPDPP